MKHSLSLVALLLWFVPTSALAAPTVCGYSVRSAFGINCPFSAATTICAPAFQSTSCDVPLRCFGGSSFNCGLSLTPTSGPDTHCPANSKSLTGLHCVPDLPVTAPAPQTMTPIKHLVVIFQENVSFD